MRNVISIGIVLLVVIMLVAYVNAPIRESLAMDQEPAAATALKSLVFPAQQQFQAGAFATTGNSTKGEFGFFTDLSGTAPFPANVSLELLPPTFQSINPQISGYRFIIYLPDGPQSAVTDPYPAPRHFSATGAALRQTDWVAYAYPADGDQGRRVFAIDQNGLIWAQLMKPPYPVAVPTWNALYGDKGWGGTPDRPWVPYRR
jgi:hypothetical protein